MRGERMPRVAAEIRFNEGGRGVQNLEVAPVRNNAKDVFPERLSKIMNVRGESEVESRAEHLCQFKEPCNSGSADIENAGGSERSQQSV